MKTLVHRIFVRATTEFIEYTEIFDDGSIEAAWYIKKNSDADYDCCS